MSNENTPPVVPQVPAPTPAPAPQPAPVVPGIPTPGAPPRMDGVPDTVNPTVPNPADDDDSDHGEIGKTGNAALDTAIQTFVSVTGATAADLDRATANAFDYGDPALIDRVFLKEKFGKHADQAIMLAEAAVNEVKASAQRKATEALQTVHTAAGSEAAWKQAVSVFNSSANPNIKEAVKALMDTGNIKAGAELLLNTVNASGLIPQENPSLQGGGNPTGSASALSVQQFGSELAALRKEAGNRSFESGPLAAKYQSLLARRQAGRTLGF